jgi:hypothetical protein
MLIVFVASEQKKAGDRPLSQNITRTTVQSLFSEREGDA